MNKRKEKPFRIGKVEKEQPAFKRTDYSTRKPLPSQKSRHIDPKLGTTFIV